MAYLVTFHWGWLLASLLLGFAMGWIAVVQRGQGVSKVLVRWLAGLAAALVAAAVARVIPGRPGYWLDLGLIMFAMYLAGCVGILAARLGGLAAEARGMMSRKLHCSRAVSQATASAGRREYCKTVHLVSRIPPNILKERVLFRPARIPLRLKTRYHSNSGSKRGAGAAEIAGQPPSWDRS
jgi:hypothetical protein